VKHCIGRAGGAEIGGVETCSSTAFFGGGCWWGCFDGRQWVEGGRRSKSIFDRVDGGGRAGAAMGSGVKGCLWRIGAVSRSCRPFLSFGRVVCCLVITSRENVFRAGSRGFICHRRETGIQTTSERPKIRNLKAHEEINNNSRNSWSEKTRLCRPLKKVSLSTSRI